MYAIIKTHKYRGVGDEQSRHHTLREAVEAHDAMEFNARSSICEIKTDEDGDEEFPELSWEDIYAQLHT